MNGSIARFADIPKWMKPGGQLWNDPRVQYHWEAVQRVKRMADAAGKAITEEQMVAALCGVMDGVPYIAETDQERAANSSYAPITSSGEFWVVYNAQREEQRYENRPRTDWPDWIDYQDLDDEFLSGSDDEPIDDDDLQEFVPGTTPWQEHIDNQRSKMVDDMASAAAKGKKWAKHGAFVLVALQALDDGRSFARARELGFVAYHASFASNIVKAVPAGLIVNTADFSTGKRQSKWKLLSWRYYDMCMEYLHPQAVLVAARKRWAIGDKNACLEMVVTAFTNSLI